MPKIDRKEAIRRIRTALQLRSGKTWSVKGSRGTSWAYIDVSSPPRRLAPNGSMTVAEAEELAKLFGLEGRVHHQGLMIPPEDRDRFVELAEGRAACPALGAGGPWPTPESAADPADPPLACEGCVRAARCIIFGARTTMRRCDLRTPAPAETDARAGIHPVPGPRLVEPVETLTFNVVRPFFGMKPAAA